MHAPTIGYMQLVKKILCYVCGTFKFGVFLGSDLIHWAIKKQLTMSCSSAGVEYRAMAIAIAEVTWISFIL